MQISGEHHQNSWLVVPKKTAPVFTSYDEDRQPSNDDVNQVIDDEDELPLELVEEASWTKEQWQALGNDANSSSSSMSSSSRDHGIILTHRHTVHIRANCHG